MIFEYIMSFYFNLYYTHQSEKLMVWIYGLKLKNLFRREFQTVFRD